MKSFARAYLATLVPFLILDGLWLAVVAQNFYQAQLGPLMAKSPVWAAAGVFYVLYIAGLVFFVVAPAQKEGGRRAAALRGAFFGLIAYATYDLTNLATLQGWPLAVTAVDLVWGALVSGLTCLAAVALLPRKA